MKKARHVRTGALVAAATAVLLAAGCQEQDRKTQTSTEYTGPPTQVTVREYPEHLPYANTYQPGVVGGGGGDHGAGMIFFSGVDFMPYSSGGSSVHPAIIGAGRVTPYSGLHAGYLGGRPMTAGIRAYPATSPGARAAASISRGGFGTAAARFTSAGA